MALISSHIQIVETTELEVRLTALEKAKQT
jgi:hypothetical protein